MILFMSSCAALETTLKIAGGIYKATREEDCYTAYEFTVGQILSSEYVYDICKGKGSPGYIYFSAEYSIRDMGSYTAYDYECIYCK